MQGTQTKTSPQIYRDAYAALSGNADLSREERDAIKRFLPSPRAIEDVVKAPRVLDQRFCVAGLVLVQHLAEQSDLRVTAIEQLVQI